jgi:hypothetical protein
MGALSERIKLHLLVHGDMVDTFKENSLNLYDSLQKSTPDFKNVKVGDINPGGFYFFQYLDDSNWMKYAPVFVADYKKFSNKIVVFAVNFNFIPLEIKGLIFDKYIKEEDFESDKFLKVNYEGIYNELLRLGFEYSLMEFNASQIKIVHKVSLNTLPQFLYSQHPINKYDPKKLMQIWTAKIDSKDERNKEIMSSSIDEFYEVNKDLSDKYPTLKEHIYRMRNSLIKYGKK